MNQSTKDQVSFKTALLPVGTLLVLIVLGLFILPKSFEIAPVPLELIFIIAACVAISQLYYLGYKWEEISESIIRKISKAMPTLLILLSIGLIIGSWIACGTIPMLVYYGIKLIHPDFLYPIAFLVPILFSTFTGTSWGSIGTVGVVIMGVAISMGAHLPITAGAIIGGSFFGDKLSPLSDTTNVAAMATEVPLMDHIKSMLYTTIPAALIALIIYFILGWIYPVSATSGDTTLITSTLSETEKAFNFSIFLLIPPLIVLIGSIRKMPTLPVLVVSSFVAVILAFLVQNYTADTIFASLFTGFNTDAFSFEASENVQHLFSRGGMYSLKEPLVISILVFVFVGSIEKINAMPIIVNRLFGFVKSAGGLVRSVLISTGITNAMTSNQYATSFIIGDAFKKKFDEKEIDRKVLSRSLEDTGTIIETLVPWHQSAIFAGATLGVITADYWCWQVFSLSNIFIAFLYTFLGFAIFKKTNGSK